MNCNPLPRRSLAAVALLVAAFSACADPSNSPETPANAPSLVSVGPNVSVGASQPDRDHTEIMVAADPENSSKLLVCSMLWNGARAQLSTGIYASFDGGQTWRLTL